MSRRRNQHQLIASERLYVDARGVLVPLHKPQIEPVLQHPLDDLYTFGAIAAANALSDIYAMGAQPILALNLVGYPVKTLPMSALGEILRGGANKVVEAGAVLLGGHSIEDHEPKYGLTVAGLVHPEQVVSKGGAQPGNALILTKPLGLGIITTGIDRRLVSAETAQEAIEWMLKLNREASEAMQQMGVRAATDVTGFGLLGHLHEMVTASSTGACLLLNQIPVLPATWELVKRDCVPDGSHNNHRYLAEFVDYSPPVTSEAELVLCDAQTSGGLLIAVASERADSLLAALAQTPTPGTLIGKVVTEPRGRISVISEE